ncbi:hypothetical protein VFPPC_12384 [Pochonia chlamydosporia 170]|uniref:Uncharacterized protein n=1 Tax=Pochonia chlamydosporia 170 TaxID=1380566 RepID=A0A179EX62_METCM|nr:hypothetical protein VFPPC_12384 [Pochonia chlamydosporia 170]OAQ57758.1 hypothetical protein VFPPC_12384 [Pochonia chlamydosporia 170]
MVASPGTATPPFLESVWGNICIIGFNNVLVGLLVFAITGECSVLLLVPIVTSAACSLAMGLDYYQAAYDHPARIDVALEVFKSLAWLIQEAGLPFYSYALVTRILRGHKRVVFLVLFWAIMVVVTITKALMIVYSCQYHLHSQIFSAAFDRHVHVGYYVAIALVECVGAWFLLRNFYAGLQLSRSSPLRDSKFYRHLIRSTEFRVVMMIAFFGICRTVTYSFRSSFRSFEGWHNIAGQLDLLVGTLLDLFPFVLFIDILASRLVFAQESITRCNNLRVSNSDASVD